MSIEVCMLPSWICRRRFKASLLKTGAVLSVLIGAASPGAAPAADAPVNWAVYDAPPFMMAGGSDHDTGIFDRIRHLLDSRLFGVPSHTLRAPFPRVVASLKDGANLCFIGGVKTPEREGFSVFSLPIAMFYPMRIVVNASDRGRFEARVPLSLAALLADRSLRTSVLKNRSLGSRVDGIIREAAPPQVHSEFGEAFRMLLADRLDYLVEFSAIATYGAQSLGRSEAFAVLPFAEMPEPVLARVMCPKTEWGRRLIARIDAILQVERRTPAYQRIVEAWAEPDDVAAIHDAYGRAFLDSE